MESVCRRSWAPRVQASSIATAAESASVTPERSMTLAPADKADSPAVFSAAAVVMTIGPITRIAILGDFDHCLLAAEASLPLFLVRKAAIKPSMPPALTSCANEPR